jgi:hypothetical protein
MAKQEARSLLDFLMDIDNYTEEDITEYIKKSGMNPEAGKEKGLNLIKKLEAQEKIKTGISKQKKYDEIMISDSSGSNFQTPAALYAFRNGEKLSEEDKQKMQTDTQKLEIAKKLLKKDKNTNNNKNTNNKNI